MRKKFYLYSILAVTALGFTACSDDDDKGPNPDRPEISQGLFVINQGNMRSNIEGSLSYIDFTTGQVQDNVFRNANNRRLGDTPQAAVVYGSKIYIGVYQSNTIEIVNRNTMVVEKQISLASAEGQSPRSLVAKDGQVYISMYNGYVSRLDTLTLSIDKSVKVGPNPEIIAIVGNNLYVPNSNGMAYKTEGYGTTATRIDLKSFTVAETFEVPLNPCQFLSNGRDLFLLAKGDYGTVKSRLFKVEDDNTCTEIAEATIADIYENNIYYINAPYGIEKEEYSIYNIKSGAKADMIQGESKIDSPCALGVDPINGKIFITSYTKENGKVGYALPGYCNEYDAQGNFSKKYNVGVGPAAVFFNYE